MSIHSWSVLCRKAVIDKETNQVSLHDIIESVEIGSKQDLPKDAAIQIDVQLMACWTRSDPETSEQGKARFRILAPDKTQIGESGEINIDLSDSLYFRGVLKISTIPVPELGRYWFVIESRNDADEWQQDSRVPLIIGFKKVDD